MIQNEAMGEISIEKEMKQSYFSRASALLIIFLVLFGAVRTELLAQKVPITFDQFHDHVFLEADDARFGVDFGTGLFEYFQRFGIIDLDPDL